MWRGGRLCDHAEHENRREQQKLYEEKEKTDTKGEASVTPEQKSRVDQSLSNANIAHEKIGRASEVTGKPTPNDTSSMDKSRGVDMDKE